MVKSLVDARDNFCEISAWHSAAIDFLWGKIKSRCGDAGVINFRSDASGDDARVAMTFRTATLASKDVLIDAPRLEQLKPGLVMGWLESGKAEVREFETDRALIDTAVYPEPDPALLQASWMLRSAFDAESTTTGQRLDMLVRLNRALRTVREAERVANRTLVEWLRGHPGVAVPGVLGVPMLFPRVAFVADKCPPLIWQRLVPDSVDRYHPVGRLEYDDYSACASRRPRFGNVVPWARTEVYSVTVPDEAAYVEEDLMNLFTLRDGIAPEPRMTSFPFTTIAMKMCEVRDQMEWSQT